MVRLTVKIPEKTKLDDEIDAIAVGVTALQNLKMHNIEKRLAK
jgi:Holliday junction resolvasome RuvABC endonuclease subunit